MAQTKQLNIKKSLQNIIAGTMIVASVGLAGCATTGAVQNNLGYEFLDSYGDYKIVRRDNDTYLEKLDGSESKRLTNTPYVYEDGEFINKGKNVIYRESSTKSGRYFIIPWDGDDSNRKEISFDEYKNMWWRKE